MYNVKTNQYIKVNNLPELEFPIKKMLSLGNV